LLSLRSLVVGVAAAAALALVPAAAQAQDPPTQSCYFVPYKICANDGGAPLNRSNTQDIGSGKKMESRVTQYRNGLMMVDSWAKNTNWFGGMRPKTLVVAVDNQGRAIWVSQVFTSSTLCGVLDVSCASQRRETFSETFPEAIGHYAASLDIYHADNPNYVDLRSRLIDAIKATKDVAQAVKDAWNDLQK
jgi:hypothetical protein